MKKDMQNIENKEKLHDSKKKNILFVVLKKHKIVLLFLLFFAGASVSFAWFIYNKTVDMSIHAHVRSWDVVLGDGNEGSHEFQISDLYPGMETSTDRINIVNNGEVSADLSIDIKSITLFGEVQSEDDYTVIVSDDGKLFTIDGYPFDLHFTIADTTLESGSVSELSFELIWDYENDEPECTVTDDSGTYNICDREDTELGEKSYEFSSNPDNDGEPSLIVELSIDIVQSNP